MSISYNDMQILIEKLVTKYGENSRRIIEDVIVTVNSTNVLELDEKKAKENKS